MLRVVSKGRDRTIPRNRFGSRGQHPAKSLLEPHPPCWADDPAGSFRRSGLDDSAESFSDPGGQVFHVEHGGPDTIGCSTWNIRLRPPEHPHLLAEKGRDTIPRNRCEGVGIGRFRGIVFRSESQVFHVEHQGESLAPLSAEDPAGSLRGQPRTIPRNRFWVPRAQLFHVEHGRAGQIGCSTWNIRLSPPEPHSPCWLTIPRDRFEG